MITVTIGMAVRYNEAGAEYMGVGTEYIVEAITEERLFYLRKRDMTRISGLVQIKILHYPFVLQLQDDTVVVAKSITAIIHGATTDHHLDHTRSTPSILLDVGYATAFAIKESQSYRLIPAAQIKQFFVHDCFLVKE